MRSRIYFMAPVVQCCHIFENLLFVQCRRKDENLAAPFTNTFSSILSHLLALNLPWNSMAAAPRHLHRRCPALHQWRALLRRGKTQNPRKKTAAELIHITYTTAPASDEVRCAWVLVAEAHWRRMDSLSCEDAVTAELWKNRKRDIFC